MPKGTKSKKGKKKFTREERINIIRRAEEVGASQAAKEYKTSWQTIKSWQRNEPQLSHEKPENPIMAPEMPPRRANKSDYTIEERNAIIAKALEFGNIAVAKVYGIDWHVITSWKREALKRAKRAENAPEIKVEFAPAVVGENEQVKQIGADLEPEVKQTKGRRGRKKLVRDNNAVQTLQQEPVKTPEVTEVPSIATSNIDFELAILREKVSVLTQQIEKLRIAVKALA